MRIIVIVDANIILSALLGGKPSSILFNPNFRFITTGFTISEVRKYLPRVEKKLGLSQKELTSFLSELPLEIYERTFYKDKLKKAEKMIGHIDKKDIDILALTLKSETYLWSQDKHFEKSGYKKILKTGDFIV